MNSLPLKAYATERSISDAEVRALVTSLSSATDLEAAWQKLSQDEQDAVMERGLSVSEVKLVQHDSNTMPSLLNGCWLADKAFGAYSAAGVHLFTFGQRVNWCDDQGNRI